jgi:hypothetical protein
MVPQDELNAIAALRAAGDHTGAHGRALLLARAHPDDVHVQMAAAYACDRLDLERDAIVYYERAWALGVPVAQRPGFLVGFGSTLRNVGRVDDAVARLGEAVAEFPDYPALRAFLALALHSAGQHGLALATMLETALTASRAGAFSPYERALAEYQVQLVEEAVREPATDASIGHRSR